jgi:hypothetical protein
MPSPRNKEKLTGDTHPPEAGEDRDTADNDGEDRGLARDLEDEGRPGKGENQAGFLKDGGKG